MWKSDGNRQVFCKAELFEISMFAESAFKVLCGCYAAGDDDAGQQFVFGVAGAFDLAGNVDDDFFDAGLRQFEEGEFVDGTSV